MRGILTLFDFMHRLISMINRAVVLTVNNTSKNQRWIVKGVSGQDKEVEVFELYGITTCPPKGQAEALRFCLEGYEDHTIALGASGGIYRPKDARDGELIIYSMWDKDSKHRVELREEKKAINLMSGNNLFSLDDEKLVIKIGNNQITITENDLQSNKDGIFAGTSVHTHEHTGDSGCTTSGPL